MYSELNALLLTQDGAYFRAMREALKGLRPSVYLDHVSSEAEAISSLSGIGSAEKESSVPDLLLLDTRLPTVSHLSFLKWQMENDLSGKMPVVLLIEKICYATIQEY